ncbi:Cfr10I/Bse634I restriction endonuclease [Crinalium epipsammum PCC 9333]|uniref:Cfr10I/Bse634I restriction endonuclease n=1 Tax=Crinalium epipsammum PCC 9333 TaxID=1173022 RepID=K9VYZ4_9CYAN|nr:Cfr10I/Bse634I family restriction endonuclease [Crinalium epipsammum]AFZ12380.1 Cfr10I/Bse634I restriction endonuclease [Crinalium epipsammum PCC 9333]
MVNNIEWFTKKDGDKVQINSRIIYRNLSTELVNKLDNNLSVNEIISWIKNTTREAFREQYARYPEVGALNNAAGRWNEFIATTLLSEIAFDINQKTDECIAVFSLPDSRLQKEDSDEVSSKFLSLFSKDEFDTGKALAKITPFKNNIFLPSPDYVIVVLANSDIVTSVQCLLAQQAKAPDTLALYNFLKGKIQVGELKAAVSLKTSNRSDRRYQPLFEAAMIKSMGYLLDQPWKYYMVASTLTPADKSIFSKAISPHSMALEQNAKLVDGTYLYNRKSNLEPLVQAAIENA